ncbi:MAG: prolyl oligopeptidase family serine peptidase [Oscillospiraceae bacterium]|jgi:predicted peptidase|nr:prolyl oligopeptidase family serine peptidase [Oscillospiraceae bacterium]
MKTGIWKLLPFLLTLVLIMSAAGGAAESQRANAGMSYKLYMECFEWGPSVTRTILDLGDEARSEDVSPDQFTVSVSLPTPMGEPTMVQREITAAYISDEDGNKLDGGVSRYVTLEFTYGAVDTGSGGGAIAGTSNLIFSLQTFLNNWVEANYTVAVSGLTVGDSAEDITIPPEAYGGKYFPQLSDWKWGSHTGGGYTLGYGSYETAALKDDGQKNALIIWLHGAGEGGTDPLIAVVGNEVAKLADTNIQSYFARNGQAGAYVLVPQSPTVWMDSGSGQHGGDQDSIYTAALKDTIDAYIEGNGDIDPNRIIIGGCSNGGYMTMNMLISYPDFFAAAYPTCEAYMDSFLTDDKLAAIKDTPIWFTQSRDDTTVLPIQFAIPTYIRLLQAGARNVHLSFFDEVLGTDAQGVRYNGHWSWVYVDKDQSVYDVDSEWVLANADAIASEIQRLIDNPIDNPSGWGGPVPGPISAEAFPASSVEVTLEGKPVTLWGWLAEITK